MKKDRIKAIYYNDYSESHYTKGIAVGILYVSGKAEILHFNSNWIDETDFKPTIFHFNEEGWKKVRL